MSAFYSSQIKAEQQKKSGDIKAKEGELANAKSQLEPLQVSIVVRARSVPMQCRACLCDTPWHMLWCCSMASCKRNSPPHMPAALQCGLRLLPSIQSCLWCAALTHDAAKVLAVSDA